jgi:integrase
MRALDITPDRVRDYQAQRRKEKASPATVNRETTRLARAFRIAVKSGLLTVVPPFPNRLEEARHVRVSSSRPSTRGEITGLTWREIDIAGGVIRLDPEREKMKAGRVLPLSEPSKEVLQRRIAARRLDSLLVFHRDGEPLIDWRKAWANACKFAGFPGRRLHDCRRTAA